MKKIGITCYPTIGGSGVIATELGKLLAKQGYEIHFITSSMPFRLDCTHPNIYYHEVEVNHYPVFQYPPYDLALSAKMAEIIDREKLDILHVHYAMPHAICAILAREISKHDVKIVTTLHGTDITVLGIDPTFEQMIKHGIEKSDAVTAVSHSLAMDTKRTLHIQKEISVIYNFINENDYYKKNDPTIKAAFGVHPDEHVIIHISNFRKVKRISDIIYTFNKVVKHMNAKLLLVGDGPESSRAHELVEKLGISDRVLFLGKQKKISDLLSISDIKLLLSEQESFGLVLLEAMACGVPCIGTNVGGIPEVITHNETGYLVELGNIDEAANRVIHLLKNKSTHAKFAQTAVLNAQTKFHSNEIVKQYIDLYDHIETSMKE
ncbi:N-acetyl-alpha-D-glucosaminyl L-malate synthase BshA [Virgibacillus sp. W0430]|uniref:N-acetyl-alpha-D-glucosaminyl L-malate synthase BshA n=1 Tax=Virgibacillus sp. W0430 TaxID=3391580 RepID=UPI003F483989